MSKKHNTFKVQRSIIINNIGEDIYWPHKCIYQLRHTRMWRKTQIALLIERVEERITTHWPDLASSSQHEIPSSPHEKLRSPNTTMFHKETNNTSLQNTRFQPLDLWDEGSIYRWLQGGDSSSGILISVFSLIVLDSTWRLMISYSSLGEFREESVTREVSGRFHDHPPCKLSLPFVYSHPSHLTERIFNMNHTFCMWQVRCIAPFAVSSQYGPILTSSQQFFVENFREMM